MKLTKEHKIAIVSAVLVTGVVTYILINRSKKKKQILEIEKILSGEKRDPNAPSGQLVLTTTQIAQLPSKGGFPFKIGNKHQKIAGIQQLLNKKFGSNIDVDGVYGESTYQSMCKNVWSVGILNNELTSCRNWDGSRKDITQEDYNSLNK